MRDTAKGMVYNMMHQLKSFGFIPNGGRLYYLNRSQPPMLSEMVIAMMDDSFDLELLREALPLLRDEYAFWMDKVRATASTRGLSPHARPTRSSWTTQHGLGYGAVVVYEAHEI